MPSIPEIYDDTTVRRMRQLLGNLSERDRRAYAAVEAYKPGSPGVLAIAKLFGMSPETIKRGKDDLDSPERLPASGRQRHTGAGRKGVCFEQVGLEDAFDILVESHLGGDPMNEGIVWTDLQPAGIASALVEQGFSISETSVRQLLRKKESANAVRSNPKRLAK